MSVTSTERLQELAGKIRQLPTLPTVYIRVAELMRDPETSATDVGKVVAHDQVIAAKLLQIVNSSFYGFRDRITTIPRAITVVGFQGLRDLILTLSALRVVRPWSDGKTFDDRSFWAHGVGCASAARAIASMVRGVDPEEAFTAGLLHDIGKLALYWFLRDEFVDVVWAAQERGEPLYRQENDAMGFNHADLGQLLAVRWRLPDELADAIAFHHTPVAARHTRIARLIHIADIIAQAMLPGADAKDRIPPLDATAWAQTGLVKDAVETLMAKTADEFEKGKEFLAIVKDG